VTCLRFPHMSAKPIKFDWRLFGSLVGGNTRAIDGYAYRFEGEHHQLVRAVSRRTNGCAAHFSPFWLLTSLRPTVAQCGFNSHGSWRREAVSDEELSSMSLGSNASVRLYRCG